MKIYNLGSLNIDYVYDIDHFVCSGETLSSLDMRIFPGGKGLNQSVALSKAGANVIHGAVLGKNGTLLTDTLSSAGVDIRRIKYVDSPCGHAIIQVDKKGQNCILLFGGTNYQLDKDYIEEFLSDAEPDDILVLQNEVNSLDIIFEIAHSKKMQIAFNPSPYSKQLKELPLSYVKWWFCNEIEGSALFGSTEPIEIANNFSKQYPNSNLILTLGSNGSIFKNSSVMLTQKIYTVEAVDTTAAGDTFTGYFIHAITSGGTPAKALEIASKASAIAVSRAGAAPSIPYADEVLDFHPAVF